MAKLPRRRTPQANGLQRLARLLADPMPPLGPSGSVTAGKQSTQPPLDARVRDMMRKMAIDVTAVLRPDADYVPVSLEAVFHRQQGILEGDSVASNSLMSSAERLSTDAWDSLRKAPSVPAFQFWLAAEVLLLDWARIGCELNASQRQMAEPVLEAGRTRLQSGLVRAGDLVLKKEQTVQDISAALVPGNHAMHKEVRDVIQKALEVPTLRLRSPRGGTAREVVNRKGHPAQVFLRSKYPSLWSIIAPRNWPQDEIVCGALAVDLNSPATLVAVMANDPWAPTSLWLAQVDASIEEQSRALANGHHDRLRWKLVTRVPADVRSLNKAAGPLVAPAAKQPATETA